MNKKEKQNEKTYYDVKIEATLPATIIYRVLAESPEEAFEEIKNNIKLHVPSSVKYNINLQKKIKATIYDAGCSVIKYMQRFVQ